MSYIIWSSNFRVLQIMNRYFFINICRNFNFLTVRTHCFKWLLKMDSYISILKCRNESAVSGISVEEMIERGLNVGWITRRVKTTHCHPYIWYSSFFIYDPFRHMFPKIKLPRAHIYTLSKCQKTSLKLWKSSTLCERKGRTAKCVLLL